MDSTMPERELPYEPSSRVSVVFIKKNILQAVKQLFGEVGSERSSIDILFYNQFRRRFILRCESDCYVKVRAALTIATRYEETPCIYFVHRTTANLLSLSADSRGYQHGAAVDAEI